MDINLTVIKLPLNCKTFILLFKLETNLKLTGWRDDNVFEEKFNQLTKYVIFKKNNNFL